MDGRILIYIWLQLFIKFFPGLSQIVMPSEVDMLGICIGGQVGLRKLREVENQTSEADCS